MDHEKRPMTSEPESTSTTAMDNHSPSLHKRPSNSSPSPEESDPSSSTTPITGPQRGNTHASSRSARTALSKRETWAALMKPQKPLKGQQPSYAQSFRRIVTCSWLNVLLVCIPISWALHFAGTSNTAVFVTSMLAIVPLAKLLGEGTEEIALRVGQTLGGLLNATLGNATELIIAILALVKCELVVVQSSLLGSILSNLLLVLGMTFFAGGLRFSEQAFSTTAAQLNSSLLVMSVVAILIPAGFHAAFSNLDDSVEGPDVLSMSRGISVILLVVYAAFLVFQLFSHAHLYVDDTIVHGGHDTWGDHKLMRPAKSAQPKVQFQVAQKSEADMEADGTREAEEDDEEIPQMNTVSACLLLAISTVFIGVTSEWLVDSINGITASGALSEAWVGLILLPIVGNAAEHVTAITTGYKDKLDISIGVAVGSSIQIALFVTPLLVVLAWMMGKPLTLLFDPFESVILFLAVLIVNYTVQDGRTNWLEGWLLMMVYVIIAVAFYYYPADAVSAGSSLGLTCT